MSIQNLCLSDTDAQFFTQVAEHQADLNTVVQKVRLCRLKLGAVLNRLENYELKPEDLKLIGEYTDEVSDDVRLLVETMQMLLDG